MDLSVLATGVATLSGMGFLKTAMDMGKAADSSLRLWRFIGDRYRIGKRRELEFVAATVSMIYDKVARRFRLFSLSAFVFGAIAAAPTANSYIEEEAIEGAVGGIPLLLAGAAATRREKRLGSYFTSRFFIKREELELLIAYERLIDSQLKKSMANPIIRTFVKDNYRQEMEFWENGCTPVDVANYEQWVQPKYGNVRTKLKSLSADGPEEKFRDVATELSQHSDQHVRSIGLNNLGVLEAESGRFNRAKEYFREALGEAGGNSDFAMAVLWPNHNVAFTTGNYMADEQID